jgi:hypothetical protein
LPDGAGLAETAAILAEHHLSLLVLQPPPGFLTDACLFMMNLWYGDKMYVNAVYRGIINFEE